MADWASKDNYNNPLFTIYNTLQSAKHKGEKEKFTDYYECENARTLSVCLSCTTEPNWRQEC